MTKQQLFEDYQLVRKMHIPVQSKVVVLTHVLAACGNPWRVVGITEGALKIFQQNGFKTKSKIGVNRSHNQSRNETFKTMLDKTFKDCDEWWEFFWERDQTILATSSENLTGRLSKIHSIDEKLNLFKASGYGWKHSKAEIEFLKQLYAANNS